MAHRPRSRSPADQRSGFAGKRGLPREYCVCRVVRTVRRIIVPRYEARSSASQDGVKVFAAQLVAQPMGRSLPASTAALADPARCRSTGPDGRPTRQRHIPRWRCQPALIGWREARRERCRDGRGSDGSPQPERGPQGDTMIAAAILLLRTVAILQRRKNQAQNSRFIRRYWRQLLRQ